MLLPKALRLWLAANHDALSRDERTIASDLAAEIENGEFAHLTTDLSIEQQVTVVATTSVADPERVGHVFRSALHWHATGGAEAAGVAKPPVPGALPPTVATTPETLPTTNTPPSPATSPNQLPDPEASSTRPAVSAKRPARSPAPLTTTAVLTSAALGLIVVLTVVVIAVVRTQSGNDVAVLQGFEPTPTAAPALPVAPEPTATTSPASRLAPVPTPTAAPSPTPTTNPTQQLDPEPAPTTNPTQRVDLEPTPTTVPATRLDNGDSLFDTVIPLLALQPSPGWSPTWTLEVSPGRILDPAARGEILEGYQVIAFDVAIRRVDTDEAAAEPPLVNPRLILVGGASETPNLGGGNFTCPADQPWPQFASRVDDVASGTMCFIESEADLASERSLLIFESDGHAAAVFPIN